MTWNATGCLRGSAQRGLMLAGLCVIACVLVFPRVKPWFMRQCLRCEGMQRCEVVIDPTLTTGGIEDGLGSESDSDLSALRLMDSDGHIDESSLVEIRRRMDLRSKLPGELSEREGPRYGQLYVAVWDFSGSFGTHGVILWLDGSDPKHPGGEARVMWLEESGSVSGTLCNLRGTIKINDPGILVGHGDGARPLIIEYAVTGVKDYDGATSVVETRNKITLRMPVKN